MLVEFFKKQNVFKNICQYNHLQNIIQISRYNIISMWNTYVSKVDEIILNEKELSLIDH